MSNHGDPLEMAEEVLLDEQERVLQERLVEQLASGMLLGRELEQGGLDELTPEQRRDLAGKMDAQIEQLERLIRNGGGAA